MAIFTSEYGEKINHDHPLPEHPNPLFQRDSFVSLNGPWDFAVTKDAKRPEAFERTILVPFAPETSSSGLGIKVKKSDVLHYRKTFEVPDVYVGHDAILHLDAVDQVCDIFFNGRFVGHHESGYFPISIHVSYLTKNNVVEVTVWDDTDSDIFPRGKQSNDPSGIWYTPTSGIWQSVWLESVPDDGYIKSVKMKPLFDEQELHLSAEFVGNRAFASVEAYFHGQLVAKKSFDPSGDCDLDFHYSFYPWTPDDPNIYELIFTAGYDVVHSYFAMRKFTSVEIGGYHFFALNNKPLFLSGVLDQGYWPESGMTPPSQEAVLFDLKLLKQCGFNCVRKHASVAPLRWYCACDRLGLLVMQDFVNGGSRYSSFLIHTRPLFHFDMSDTNHKKLGRILDKSREQYKLDYQATIDRLFNVPSVFAWTLFNEGWGQFDSALITDEVRSADPTRLLDTASGWYDKGFGDFKSDHIYFWTFLNLHNDNRRILGLSECGGYSLKVEHHVYSNHSFGYRYYHSFAAYNDGVSRLYRKRVLTNIKKQGLNLVIFTQLSDVEEEENGLVTFDRKIVKINVSDMRSLNVLCYEYFYRLIASLTPKNN
jgi:beta-galactosidase/beta-glucuronidase